MSAPHWAVFQRRVRIQGHLVTRTALHIGAGDRGSDPTALDDTVFRDADGNPLIPGSSLKGALAAFLRRVATAGWLAGASDGKCCHAMEQREWDDWVKKVSYDVNRIYARLCPACRLTGVPHYAGRLQVRDLAVVPGQGPGRQVQGRWRVRLTDRNGVGIHRDTGTAAHKVLYDFEAVPPGVRFGLDLWLENPTQDEWQNLLVGLLALARGDIPLGGKVTRGLGAVGLEEVRIWDLARGSDRLRRYVLGTSLQDLPYQTLEDAAAQAGLAVEARRVPLERLREALAGDRSLSWQEALDRLQAVFGGNGDV